MQPKIVIDLELTAGMPRMITRKRLRCLAYDFEAYSSPFIILWHGIGAEGTAWSSRISQGQFNPNGTPGNPRQHAERRLKWQRHSEGLAPSTCWEPSRWCAYDTHHGMIIGTFADARRHRSAIEFQTPASPPIAGFAPSFDAFLGKGSAKLQRPCASRTLKAADPRPSDSRVIAEVADPSTWHEPGDRLDEAPGVKISRHGDEEAGVGARPGTGTILGEGGH